MHLLDANVLIEAKNDYYSFDVAPGFWAWLLEMHAAGAVASVPAVRKELVRQDDELAEWARAAPGSFWLTEGDATASALKQVAAWAMSPHLEYRPAARTEFLAAADYRLIAAGLAGNHTVVTREQPAPGSKRRILIPDACDAQKVPYFTPFALYRRLGLRLIQA